MDPRSEATLATIYQGASAPEQWQAMMVSIGQLFGASSGFFFSTHSARQPAAAPVLHNIDPVMLDRWHAHWHREDIWAEAVMRRGGMNAGTVVLADELLRRDEVVRTGFYNDHLRPYALEGLLGAVLFDDSGELPMTHLCWYRDKAGEAFELDDKRLLQRLLPHLQEAARLRWRLAGLQRETTLAAASEEASTSATLLIDSHGRVLHASAKAQAVLAGRFGSLLQCRAGCIVGLGEHCEPPLQPLLAAASRGRPGRLLARCRNGLLFEASVVRDAADGRFLLIIDLPSGGDAQELAGRAAGIFGFTPAESAVAARLLEGASAEQIANERRLSLNTIRTHIKSLLAKAGVGRQTDLVRQLGRFVRPPGAEAASSRHS